MTRLSLHAQTQSTEKLKESLEQELKRTRQEMGSLVKRTEFQEEISCAWLYACNRHRRHVLSRASCLTRCRPYLLGAIRESHDRRVQPHVLCVLPITCGHVWWN